MMPRFELFTVITFFLIFFSGYTAVENGNPLGAVVLTAGGAITMFVVRNDLENAKWEISAWYKILPGAASALLVLLSLYMVFRAAMNLGAGMMSLATLLVVLLNAGVALVLAHALVFLRPGRNTGSLPAPGSPGGFAPPPPPSRQGQEFCIHCGSSVEQGANFCTNCGKNPGS